MGVAKRPVEGDSDGEDQAAARPRTGATAPNILVTGTPGTGKTALSAAIASRLAGLKHVSITELAEEIKAHDGWDAERDCHVLDEDALLDALEPRMAIGGCVVDYHAAELFPERWFDLVLVLRTKTEVLYDRLLARGYAENKIRENVECEIMQVLLEEAHQSYSPQIVVELQSDAQADVQANVDRVVQWHAQWQQEHAPAA
ncbi:AAA domain-containing protein [Pelagophyceae sp. CCMP2097]|nr:AAA domain-containing protein [Pelagophyceae sp. CCMP2097]|mmetsp:Transcript_934/g.3321  ORF Transcript_934/g.3321 Transcript_934/m.3321 type:complete len:201 (-) Transcript_934:73-675(-)